VDAADVPPTTTAMATASATRATIRFRLIPILNPITACLELAALVPWSPEAD
jgi:hypothetical protein